MKRFTLLLLAGCFGGGNKPVPASGITELYTPPPPSPGEECTTSTFVGAVAFGTTHAFAVSVPYVPSGGNDLNCCGSGMCPSPSASLLQVFQFDKLTPGTSMKVGMPQVNVGMMTGSSFGSMVRMVAVGDSPLYVTPAPSGGMSLLLSTGQTTTGSGPSGGGFFVPAGIVADASTAWVGGWNTNTFFDPDNPTFACCGPNSVSPTPGTFTKVFLGASPPAPQQMPVSPTFLCTTTDTCLTANTADLFYVSSDPTGQTYVDMFPKTGTLAVDERKLFMLDSSAAPTGLVANDQFLAWVESANYVATIDPQPTCEIGAWDLSGLPKRVFSSSSFSCMGAALDGASLYFTIVAPDTSVCCPHTVDGVGIGRLSLTDGTIETLNLHVMGAVGPRRVVVDGGNLYIIDPLAVLKLDPHALDGAHDFAP